MKKKLIFLALSLFAFGVFAAVVPQNWVLIPYGDSLTAFQGRASWAFGVTNASYLNVTWLKVTNCANNGWSIETGISQYVSTVRPNVVAGVTLIPNWFGANNGLMNAGDDVDFINKFSTLHAMELADGASPMDFTVILNYRYTNATWRANWTNVNRWLMTNIEAVYHYDVASQWPLATFSDPTIWDLNDNPGPLHLLTYPDLVNSTNFLVIVTNVPPIPPAPGTLNVVTLTIYP